jgi:hypothetical protein
LPSITMTEVSLTIGSALLAFGPFLSLFGLLVYQKAQLVIVVTTAAFFFLLAAVTASLAWTIFHAIGLGGPLAALVPGVFFQFAFRCGFVALYHNVEQVIQNSMEKSDQRRRDVAHPEQGINSTDAPNARIEQNITQESDQWTEATKLRLQLNDASCGVAAGVGFGGMHVIMLYGTLWASQVGDSEGVLYQDACPQVPSLALSAVYAFLFSILDVFWMLFTFFGMRRRRMFHRGAQGEDEYVSVGAWFGNSRTGGNFALLLCLVTHSFAAVFTTADYFNHGCLISIPLTSGMVFVTAYLFWAGVGRIYMPPSQIAMVHGEAPAVSFHED